MIESSNKKRTPEEIKHLKQWLKNLPISNEFFNECVEMFQKGYVIEKECKSGEPGYFPHPTLTIKKEITLG